MTIEEKAKAYDEAVKKAESLYKVSEPMSGCNVIIETLFPELKESEDERIRKALMQNLKERFGTKGNMGEGLNMPDVLAWLEKQGEHANFRNKIQIGDKVTRNQDGILVNLSQLNRVAKDEKQGEQKSNDKVEPKFKVGDWVVSPNGVYWHIDKISNSRYEVTSDTGESSNWPLDTNIYHKFNIQDAKDGDVLCTYECAEPKIVFILKGTPKKHYALSYHCYYNIMYPHFESDSKKGCLAPNDKDVKPATKEQRDQLEKAISDAGYTFDFEKKELKKIEQKPVEIVKWSPQEESCICQLESLVKEQWRQAEKVHNSINIKKMSELMFFLKTLNPNKKPQRIVSAEAKEAMYDKPAWSEEDGKNLRVVVDYLIADNGLSLKYINWLNSLKYRVIPQSKQEWSEEDNQYLCGLIGLIEQSKAGLPITLKGKAADNCIDWLKSLRPQKQQEWNKQDIEMIDWLIRCCEKEHEELCNDRYGHQDIVSDLKRDCRKKWDWLESLKNKVVPQNRWKPTEIQLKCLKDVCDKHFDLDGLDPLYTLYEQLKAL